MATIVTILIGLGLGWSYTNKGLFLASKAFIAVLLACLTSLGFSAQIAHLTDFQSPYTYVSTMAGLWLMSFAACRGAMGFMSDDVDFHPLVERLGGGVLGLASGLMLGGFLSVCLTVMPVFSPLKFADESFRDNSDMILWPCKLTARLLPGERLLSIKNIVEAGGRYGRLGESIEPPVSPPIEAANPPPVNTPASENTSPEAKPSDPPPDGSG